MTASTAHGIKLHLGCGQVYRLGYLNIDALDDSVADEVSDISRLRFDSDSIDEIYSSQLIEHFDYIHCKYVLSEWYRVLKPNALLEIETPDLRRTYKKLVSSGISTQKNTLQWVFGLDSPGLLHKTGFTFELLEDLLKEIGFVSIERHEQQTHMYEPGMRVSAVKPANDPSKKFTATLRRGIATEFTTSDSYVMIPMEDHIKRGVSLIADGAWRNPDTIDRMLAIFSACDARLGRVCLESSLDNGFIDEKRARERRSILEHMADMHFTEKSFTLWTRSRKERGVEVEFAKFLERVEATIHNVISGERSMPDEWKYITELDRTEIPMLDFRLAMMEARKWFNVGVKRFFHGSYSEALVAFEMSERINPDNPLTHWNIARLGVSQHLGEVRISNSYEASLELTTDSSLRRSISKEYADARKNGFGRFIAEPVPGD